MKKRTTLLTLVLLLGLGMLMTACYGINPNDQRTKAYYNISSEQSYEEYLKLQEQDFINAAEEPKYYISLDSSTAAYANIRKKILNRKTIPTDAVNIEQMINYFNYSYVNDTSDALKTFMEISDCPWNEDTSLLNVAIKAENYEIDNNKPNNFVFLLDTSGSMCDYDKLPLMVEAFRLLLDNLNDNDRISVVTYGSKTNTLLSGAYGKDKNEIYGTISQIEAQGATYGSKAIQTAYSLAEKYYIKGGNNRIFLATDGDFNVGISSIEGLKNFISEKRKTGVYLSVLGFGTGNTKASTMDTLAKEGNGNYYYVDSVLEAKKLFVTELNGTLQTVAKDTKAQIEFNPEIVESYRVIGYENKILSERDFNNPSKDAGEIGAGTTVICLFEVKLVKEPVNEQDLNFAKCTIKYKNPLTNYEKELITICNKYTKEASADFTFAASVAEFGLILRNSNHKANASYQNILNRVDNEKYKTDQYREEFCELVRIKMNEN